MRSKLYDNFTGAGHVKKTRSGKNIRSGKWWVVGDIHGRYDQLMEQLGEVGFNFKEDILFALGDLVDRGDKSWECLQLIYEPWFKSILGNHEQLMWDGLHGLKHLWIQNGGDWWVTGGHFQHETHKQEACELILNLPNYRTLHIGDKTVGLIHASAGTSWPPNKSKLSDYDDPTIWDRKALYGVMNKVANVDLVVVGHNPVKEVTKQNNTLLIDTGYATGRLSVLNIEDLIGGV